MKESGRERGGSNSQWKEVSFGRETNPLTNRIAVDANGINRLPAKYVPHFLSCVGLLINTPSGQI